MQSTAEKEAPFFTVIIPTLNEEKDLPKLLTDLDNQSFRDFEIFVVDGNSSDTTQTIVKTRMKTNSRLRLYTHSAKNVAAQRNFGSEHATSQYLIFFDADVRIPKGFLHKLYSHLESTKALLATTSLMAKENQQTQIILMELTNFMIEVLNILGKPFAPGFNIICERMLFVRLGGFDTTLKLAEDHDLIQRARKIGVMLKVFKDVVLYPSFRRPEKIGYIEFLRQYTIAGIYTLMGQQIKKDLFSYPMGGHVFNNTSAPSTSGKLLKSLRERAKRVGKYIELPF